MARRFDLWVAFFVLVALGSSARADWAGGDSTLELNTARTLPLSHYSLHLWKPSSLGVTDRIQLSSNLTLDLLGVPNLDFTWSMWQRPWCALAIELGTGARVKANTPDTFWFLGDNLTGQPHFLVGGLGTLNAGRHLAVTANLRYIHFGDGLTFGASPAPASSNALSAGLSAIVQLGKRDAVWIEARGTLLSTDPAGSIAGAGIQTGAGATSHASAWYAHAFDHTRVSVGVMTPPALLPDSARDWPVIPALELWWDLERS